MIKYIMNKSINVMVEEILELYKIDKNNLFENILEYIIDTGDFKLFINKNIINKIDKNIFIDIFNNTVYTNDLLKSIFILTLLGSYYEFNYINLMSSCIKDILKYDSSILINSPLFRILLFHHDRFSNLKFINKNNIQYFDLLINNNTFYNLLSMTYRFEHKLDILDNIILDKVLNLSRLDNNDIELLKNSNFSKKKQILLYFKIKQ